MARRNRQVIDLYSSGRVVELKDGTPLWVRPLNPFEQDTARSEAQIARSRITLGIKEEGSEELAKVRMWFEEDGLDAARDRLVTAKVSESTARVYESIRNDPEWTERMAILDRGLDGTATPPEDVERRLLEKITTEFTTELGERLQDEKEFETTQMLLLDDEALWEAYVEWYVNERAGDIMLAEYRLQQVLFGTRWCDGDKDAQTNTWTHADCNGHPDQFFEDTLTAREAPDSLLELLYTAADEVDMTVREAKNSDRQGSSSGSSPLPSEEEASTASTPSATQPEPRGSSSQPSATPSPSSDGES